MMIDIGFATYDIPQIMHPEALVVTVGALDLQGTFLFVIRRRITCRNAQLFSLTGFYFLFFPFFQHGRSGTQEIHIQTR